MTYSIEIGKIKQSVDVNFDGFTETVRNYVIDYGLTQILNDCHSQETKTIKDPTDPTGKRKLPNPDYKDENVLALVMKRLDALNNGDLRAARAEREAKPDTVESTMLDIATDELKRSYAKAKPPIKVKAADLKERAKARVVTHYERLHKEALAYIAKLDEMSDDIDVSSI
mgnify:CR=1 FL=1